MSFVSAFASVVAAITGIIILYLYTRKTTIILTFHNNKDQIQYETGEKTIMRFFITNTGKVSARSIEAILYFPEGVKAERFDRYVGEAAYFTDPERIVLKVNTLPPKSSPEQRITSFILFPSEPQKLEFPYEIIGDRVKSTKGKLIVETKSRG